MFCLFTSSKLSRLSIEFSLKVKMMGSNPGFLNLFYFKYTINGKVGSSLLRINGRYKLTAYLVAAAGAAAASIS